MIRRIGISKLEWREVDKLQTTWTRPKNAKLNGF